jgi:hypothetical protein
MTMRIGRRYFLHGLELRPTTVETEVTEGTILVNSSEKILKIQLGDTLRKVITDTQFQTVINKVFGISTESNTTNTGSEASLPQPTTGGILLKNTSLNSIANIGAGVSGQQLTIFNRTGNYVGVIDSSAIKGITENRILTGTGASISLAPNASLNLTYDLDAAKWQVVGGSGGGGLTFQAVQPPSPIGPFNVLTPIYHDGLGWKKAIANGLNPNTLATYIVVESSQTSFTAAKFGVFTIQDHGKTVGEFYYVSAATEGTTTSDEPITGYSNPVFYVEDQNKIHAMVHRPTSLQKTSSFVDDAFYVYDLVDTTKKFKIDVDGNFSTTTTLKSSQTQDRTLILPDITDTLVTKNTIDTLTNKTLVDSTTTIVDASDTTKKLRFDIGGTTNTSTTIISSQTTDRILSLPNNTGTLVSTGDIGTVTSAMIADSTIVDADISTTAAIARSKTAAGSAYRLVTNGSDGKLIDAAAITPAKVLISDANGIPTSSSVTSAELVKLSGSITTTNTVLGTSSTGALVDVPGLTYTSNAIILNNTKHLEEQAITDAVTTGTASVMTLGNSGVLRITNASLASLSGITGGADGRKLVLLNRTGRAVVLLNESTLSATITNRIITGTATDLSMANNSAVALLYDATTQRWQVVGGSGSGSGGSSGANTSLSNLTSPTTINASLLPNANAGLTLGTIDDGWDIVYAGGYRTHNKAKTITITTTTNNYTVTVSSIVGIVAGVSRIVNTTAFPGMPEGLLVTSVGTTTVTVESSSYGVTAVTASSSKVLSPLDLQSLSETVAGTQSAPVVIKSGTTLNGSSRTGSITVASSDGTAQTGNISIATGTTTGFTSGSISITTGLANSLSGDITIKAGDANGMVGTEVAGNITIQAGNTNTGLGGNVTITAPYKASIEAYALVKISNNTKVYERAFSTTLSANINTATTISNFSIDPTNGYGTNSQKFTKINYLLVENTTGEVRCGTLLIAAKSSSVFSINDTYTETAKIGNGVEFLLAQNSGVIALQYKGTSTNTVSAKFDAVNM